MRPEVTANAYEAVVNSVLCDTFDRARWNDLTTTLGDLAPSNSFTLTVTFKAQAKTDSTTNVAIVTDAVDENGNKVSGTDPANLAIVVPVQTPPPPPPAGRVPARPVGGYVMSTNKLSILTPYLALSGLVGVVSAVVLARRRRKD